MIRTILAFLVGVVLSGCSVTHGSGRLYDGKLIDENGNPIQPPSYEATR